MPLLLSLLSRYWTHIAVVVVSLAVIGWAHHTIYQKGWEARDKDWREDTLKREEYGRQERERLQLANDQIAINLDVIRVQQQRKHEIDVRKVHEKEVIYRESPDAGKCSIPDSFVCIVDTSYEGLPEEAADTCRKNIAPGRLSDIELLSFTTDAKSVWAQCRDEVMWWREREAQLQAVQ